MADVAKLGLEIDSSAAKKGAAALDDLSTAAKKAEGAASALEAAYDAAGASAASLGRQTGKAAADIQGYTSAADRAAAETTGLSSAMTAQASAAMAAANANTKAAKAANDNGTKAGAANVANLAAQFQDVAVTAAMMQSPIQIALQQGTQLSAILGPMGAGGAVRALGAALLSVLSPVSLVTIGIVALVAAGLQYVATMVGATDSLDDKLKEHKELIASIKDAYGKALEGVDLYAKKSFAVLEAQARSAAISLGEELRKSLSSALGGMQSSFIDPNDIIGDKEVFAVKQRFSQFSEAINQLRAGLTAGAPDVRAFRQAVAEIANSDPTNVALQNLAAELLKLTDQAGKVDDALTAAQRAIAATANVASGSTGAIAEFRKAMEDLAKVSATVTPRQAAEEAYLRARAAATSPGAKNAAEGAYIDALKRIDAAEQKLADARAAREASKMAGKADDVMASAQEKVAALQIEAATLGMTTQAAAAYRLEHEAINRATQAGVTLSPQQTTQLQQLASQYGAVTAEIEKAKAAQEQLNQLQGAASSFFSDLRNGLQQGQSFADSFTKAVTNLTNKLLDMLMNKLLMQLLKSLFNGFADGGTVGTTTGASYTKLATGGHIRGPGSGTSDTAGLFALSNGEFVMNAASTRRWLPLLHAMNDNKTSGLAIPRMAAGGFVGGGGAASMAFATPQVQIINQTGVEATGKAETVRGANGQPIVRMVLNAVKKDYASGGFDKVTKARNGVGPAPTRRG